jgi:hypothetical protein
MNVFLEYLYRDAGNNKIWGNVIFRNTKNLGAAQIEIMLRKGLIEDQFFSAEDAGVIGLSFDRYDAALDHGWHELVGVCLTEESPTDGMGRDIVEFIEVLNGVSSGLRSGSVSR